jgi:hypothetical protein
MWAPVLATLAGLCATPLDAETLLVASGGDLQGALDRARPGDTILLAEGGVFVGNFVLPKKTGDDWITVRTSAPDALLPPTGERIRPEHARLLARLRSPNTLAALRTAPGAHHWRVQYLEFSANYNGYGDIIQIGDGSSAQDTLEEVPHHILLGHVYVRGDPMSGQKRGIALNAAHVTIRDSHVSECKAVGQDAQAIAGWNGPGPFVIENNHLEAAGENVLFGGADPGIPYLVPDGITFRRNYLSRPMWWLHPIIDAPQRIAATTQVGGALVPGVYAYRVVARRAVGQGTMGRSTASVEVAATVAGPASAVRLRWDPTPGATEYRVYGRTPGAQSTYWRVTTPEFVDTGGAGSAEDVPTTPGTSWTVKNLFELKNARNVVVEENILQNHWKQAQSGYAIVLTPRNQGGRCPWCVVENVSFEYNLIRNVAAGINLLGYDLPAKPTRQTNHITFRNNLFTGLTTALGGNAWFMLIGNGPRDLIIEHNTIDSNGTAVAYVYGGAQEDPREVLGFRFMGNAARHGTYGFAGMFFPYGNDILRNFYPAASFARNYLAGGHGSSYPEGNLFDGAFDDQFASVETGDYSLHSQSILKGGAFGNRDIGVDFSGLVERIAGVETGVPASVLLANLPPTAAFTWTCADLACTFTDGSRDGDGHVASWKWQIGATLTAAVQSPSFTFAGPGTYYVTLAVRDDDGAESAVTSAVQVVAALHAAPAGGTTTRWDSRYTAGIHYWSAEVPVIAHGADERPIAGATITAAWSGALTRNVSCVTDVTGECRFKSGTLSMLRSLVTLTITGVAASLSTFDPTANHRLAGSGPPAVVTLVKP